MLHDICSFDLGAIILFRLNYEGADAAAPSIFFADMTVKVNLIISNGKLFLVVCSMIK